MTAYRPLNIEYLKNVLKANPKDLKKLIKSATKSNLTTIAEIALNIQNGNLPLHPEIRTKLKRHRRTVFKLASRRTGYKKKKQILKQKRGILPLLATPFLAALGTLAGETISKYI